MDSRPATCPICGGPMRHGELLCALCWRLVPEDLRAAEHMAYGAMKALSGRRWRARQDAFRLWSQVCVHVADAARAAHREVRP